MTIGEQRFLIEKEALSWQDTPFHDFACIKGVGVDCAWFIAGVFNQAMNLNLTVEQYFPRWYQIDKNVKEKNEIYFNGLLNQGFIDMGFVEGNNPVKGDVVISKIVNKLYCHAGIVIEWPKVIHACGFRGVELVPSAYSSYFFGRDIDSLKFLTRREWL